MKISIDRTDNNTKKIKDIQKDSIFLLDNSEICIRGKIINIGSGYYGVTYLKNGDYEELSGELIVQEIPEDHYVFAVKL